VSCNGRKSQEVARHGFRRAAHSADGGRQGITSGMPFKAISPAATVISNPAGQRFSLPCPPRHRHFERSRPTLFLFPVCTATVRPAIDRPATVISNAAGRRFSFHVCSCKRVGLRREKSLFLSLSLSFSLSLFPQTLPIALHPSRESVHNPTSTGTNSIYLSARRNWCKVQETGPCPASYPR
jgi:hypothetical protein